MCSIPNKQINVPSYNRSSRTMCDFCSKLIKTPEWRQDVILVLLLLTLNKFHILFWCFHCWLSTSKCQIGCGSDILAACRRLDLFLEFLVIFLMLYIFSVHHLRNHKFSRLPTTVHVGELYFVRSLLNVKFVSAEYLCEVVQSKFLLRAVSVIEIMS